MQLSYTSSILANSIGFGAIGGGLATVNMQGTIRLVFSAREGNWLTETSLGPAPAPSPQGDVLFAPQFGPEFGFQLTESLPRFFNISAFNNPMTMNTVNPSGTLMGANVVATPAASSILDARTVQVLEFGSGDFMALAQRISDGITLYRLSDDGALSAPITIADTAKTYLGGITDTASLQRGADQLLLTLSGLENGISSHRITAAGGVEWIDSYGAQNGLAVSGLSMMQTVQIGGVDFVVLAATGSSSLSVLRVNTMGVFFETDHVVDDLGTRFAQIAVFDGFVAQGRMFFVAAGTDAGLSLFELLPDGTLSHMETFVLEGGVGLAAVTGIQAQVLGSSVGIFMVDAGADQIFRFDLDLGNLGARIAASGGSAIGTAANERLLGSAGDDLILGGAGDDFLHDGAGSDTLTGGAGADVFVFARDGAQDYITDFEDGIDRIDISAWGRIYSSSVLSITQTATGAEVVYGDERLIITSANGQPLSSATLTDADFIF